MKKNNYWAAYLVVFTMIFASCSKDEISNDAAPGELVEMKFSALLNDFNKAQIDSKSHVTPQCPAEDDEAAYVIARVDGTDYELQLNSQGKTMTGIKLPAGDYMLQEFVVYNDNDEPMWAAPHTGADFGNYVSAGQSLPRLLSFQSGAKPYENQEVLCFTPLTKDFFGFVFFTYTVLEFDNFCLFVNYCEDGMDYPALFNVEVYEAFQLGEFPAVAIGDPLNIPGPTQNEILNPQTPQASVLCIPLPPLSNEATGWIVIVNVLQAGIGYEGTPVEEVYVTPDMLPQADGPEGVEHIVIPCFPGGEEPLECENGGIYNPDRCSQDYNNFTCLYGKVIDLDIGNGGGWIFVDPTNNTNFNTWLPMSDGLGNTGAVKLVWDGNKIKAISKNTTNGKFLAKTFGEIRLTAGNGPKGNYCGEVRCDYNCQDDKDKDIFRIIDAQNPEAFWFRAKSCVKEEDPS